VWEAFVKVDRTAFIVAEADLVEVEVLALRRGGEVRDSYSLRTLRQPFSGARC
jgi:hypothetical protein